MGLFSNLFGGPSGYRKDQSQALNQQRGIGMQYGQMAGQAQTDYGQWNPQANNAVNSYADQLRQGIGNSYRTGMINSATSTVGNNFLQGQAGLTSDLASRGFGGSGSMAGGLSALAAQRIGAISSAANNANMQAQNLSYQRGATLADLMNGQANAAYGRRTAALGAQAGINNQVFSGYGDLAQADEARQAANMQALSGLAMGGAQLYGRSAGWYREK